MPNDPTRPKIALALGSGGARGLAHLGVIDVLEDHGLTVDAVAGSSIGALVGALYASGTDRAGLRRIASDTDVRRVITLFDPSLRQGFLRGTKLKNMIEEWVGGLRVEGCSMPLAVVATDLRTGQAVVFREGDLASAVRASVSVPWVFAPVEIDDRLLADGGLSIPVPAEPARALGGDVVIAVDLDWERPFPAEEAGGRETTPKRIAEVSIALLRRHLAAENARHADAVVRPSFGREVRWDGFLDPDELIEAGRVAAQAALPNVRAALRAARRRISRRRRVDGRRRTRRPGQRAGDQAGDEPPATLRTARTMPS